MAEIVGYGNTCDAYHMTSPHPEGLGAIKAMKLAISEAGLEPADIDYINAHGTSTPANEKGKAKLSYLSSARTRQFLLPSPSLVTCWVQRVPLKRQLSLRLCVILTHQRQLVRQNYLKILKRMSFMDRGVIWKSAMPFQIHLALVGIIQSSLSNVGRPK